MLDDAEKEIVSRLLSENDEFKRLYEEHQDLEEKVERLASRKAVSPEEEIEMVRLKKLKLAGKDRMERIIQEAQQEGAGQGA
ncbi:MAG: YdcH family protein [Candidatus Nitrospinota bacterium M3_3B_026]